MLSQINRILKDFVLLGNKILKLKYGLKTKYALKLVLSKLKYVFPNKICF